METVGKSNTCLGKAILVAGGAGFIGSHLCDQLLQKGNYVTCIDNFITGSQMNLAHLRQNPKFRVIQQDITLSLERLSLDVTYDQIYNLACIASPTHYQRDPIKTVECSTIGMSNLLKLALKHQARILQASTSEVYGDPLKHPQKENYWGHVNPIGIRGCYDEGKRVAETLCMDYYRQHGLQIRIVRIFNTYGPRLALDDGRVVSNFIVQALNGGAVEIYGTGMQTRSFLYVSDLVDGLIKMMEQKDFKGPVNLGSTEEQSVLELAERIIRLTGSKSAIVYKNPLEDEPVRRQPDITLAKNLLQWVPTIGLDEGLGKTIAYFKSLLI